MVKFRCVWINLDALLHVFVPRHYHLSSLKVAVLDVDHYFKGYDIVYVWQVFKSFRTEAKLVSSGRHQEE